MKNILNNAMGNELLFVYGLIVIVIIFIIVIIILDKKESKKKTQNLFDTLNMKIIADPYENKANTTEKKSNSEELEILEIENTKEKNDFVDLEPLSEVKVIDESLQESIKEIEEDYYVESELDKTQAQLRVEEITNALKEAQVEEKIEMDKYEQFEEEQEKNAIISYNELVKSFDKLYSENEKIQYLEDDEIPINIDELYQKHQEQSKPQKKVKLDDFTEEVTKTKPVESIKQHSTFKSSPYISPVYGIQEPPVTPNENIDCDIQKANQFLSSLKELKSNLE